MTAVLSADGFAVVWTALLLGCLWWLGGRNVLVALALIAFLPVAVELRVRNVHLVIAVLAVLALRRSWAFWIPATAIKITPVLGHRLPGGRRTVAGCREGGGARGRGAGGQRGASARGRGGSSSTSWGREPGRTAAPSSR